MKFPAERKKMIMEYILTKISESSNGLSGSVSQAFGIGTSTVHLYLKELIDKGVICKSGRDKYSLIGETNTYLFTRSKGEIISEDEIYKKCLYPVIKNFSENVRQIWEYSFTEMVNNVVDHSDAEYLKIIVTQNVIRTNVEIVDDGIGIFRKIQQHFGYTEIDDAIVELSKGKLTTDSRNHSGEGIFFTSRVMDSFIIYSDKKMFSFNKYMEENLENADDFVSGTMVVLSLSNNSYKQLSDIFREYAESDNGFFKTRIPIDNIFDTAPISRSQAKRICSRLDQFKEVEFDFANVEFMGQGFAHEIFYVFANKNPQVKLVPINMNESVENMYNHVKTNQ